MKLGELIELLENADQTKVVSIGFHNPHSYRGWYDELAFEPKKNVLVSEMLKSAKYALGETFTGWKGGEFTMGKNTKCHISAIGKSYDCSITKILIYYMIGSFPSINAWDDIFKDLLE